MKWISAVFLAALLGAEPAAAAVLTRGPYLQLLTTHSVTVVWNTDVAGACSLTVRSLAGGPATTIGEGSGTVCAIPVDGLTPGARYGYVPNADGVPLRTESAFHADDPAAPFTLLAVGDSGEPGPAQLAVRDQMLAAAADAIVHTGDMVYPSGAAAAFDPAFFTPYTDLVRQLVFWPCLGNHDYATLAGQPWRDAFYTPANNPAATENYYSFDVGNAHVVVLNSNASTAPGSAQYTFLDQDLAGSPATWKFVSFHHTIYSSGTTHGSNLTIRANLVPLFDAHAVDIVFMGHEHNYERTYPLRGNQVVPGAGTVYITTGGGGKTLYPFGPLSSFTAYAQSVNHFVRVAIDDETLSEEMIDSTGRVNDSMTLAKSGQSGTATTTSTTLSTSTTTTSTAVDLPSTTTSTVMNAANTTTTTIATPSTTSTTRPSRPAPCTASACDDGDPCTVDTCAPDRSCRHERVDLAVLTRSIEDGSVVGACAGQPVRAMVVGPMSRARWEVGQAATARNHARVRRLVHQALQNVRRSGRRAAFAARQHRISPGCADALAAKIQAAEARGTCLEQGS